jgi:hypothetical protein
MKGMKMSEAKKYTLAKEIVEVFSRYIDKPIDFKEISCTPGLSASFINFFRDRIYWAEVAEHQALPIDLLNLKENQKYIAQIPVLIQIVRHQHHLTDSFVTKHLRLMDPAELLEHQPQLSDMIKGMLQKCAESGEYIDPAEGR